MRPRPASRIAHESLSVGELALLELAARFRNGQHIPPGREVMHGNSEVADDFFALWKNVIEEEDEGVLNLAARLAQRIAKVNLAAAVRGHILDQQHALAFDQMTFNLRSAAEALRFLADVEHG